MYSHAEVVTYILFPCPHFVGYRPTDSARIGQNFVFRGLILASRGLTRPHLKTWSAYVGFCKKWTFRKLSFARPTLRKPKFFVDVETG